MRYTWQIGWIRPDAIPDMVTTREYLTLATARAGFLEVIESDLRDSDSITPDQRDYWSEWLSQQRLNFANWVEEEQRLGTLEGDAVFVGGYMIWMALLPSRR